MRSAVTTETRISSIRFRSGSRLFEANFADFNNMAVIFK